MIPYPLLDYCNERKLEYRAQPGETAKYDILIWHKQDTDMISRLFRDEP